LLLRKRRGQNIPSSNLLVSSRRYMLMFAFFSSTKELNISAVVLQ